MRRLVTLAVISLLLFSIAACNSPTDEQDASQNATKPEITAAEISDRILEEIDFPKMSNVSGRISRFYAPYSNDDFAEVSAYLCSESVLTDEIAIFKVKDPAKVNEIKNGLDNHYDVRAEEYSSYAPKEAERVTKRLAVAKGTWLIYIISNDNSAAEEIISVALP